MPAAVRLGLIGVGRWGRNIVRTVTGLGGRAALAAMASRNPDTAGLVPADCRLFTDWRDLLDAGDLDGVIIATPPALHAEMALAAIGAGIAVLVEKPLTMNVAEAEAVAAAATAAKVSVMVDHIHLYNPAFRRLLELAPDLGDIRAVHARAGNRGPYRADSSVLWDWGPHDVAMMLRLFGRAPDRVAARRLDVAMVGGITAETIGLTLEFGMIAAEAHLGTLMDRCRLFTVECDGGTLSYDDFANDKLTFRPIGGGARAVAVAGETPLTGLVREFAAVAGGAVPPDDGLDLGLQAVRILAEAERQLERQ